MPGLEFTLWKSINTGWSVIQIPGRRYQDLHNLFLKHQCGQIVIPVGSQPARMWKQSFPANSFDIEISGKQKIESLICAMMRDHLVISKSCLKECVVLHESKDRHFHCVDRSSWTVHDFMVINSDSFIFSHLAISHQNSHVLSENSQFVACAVPSCQSLSKCSFKASFDLPLSSVLLWRGLKFLVWNDIWSD